MKKEENNQKLDSTLQAQAIIWALGGAPMAAKLPGDDRLNESYELLEQIRQTPEYRELAKLASDKKIDAETFRRRLAKLIKQAESDKLAKAG